MRGKIKMFTWLGFEPAKLTTPHTSSDQEVIYSELVTGYGYVKQGK
jgi:hypothetical protein